MLYSYGACSLDDHVRYAWVLLKDMSPFVGRIEALDVRWAGKYTVKRIDSRYHTATATRLRMHGNWGWKRVDSLIACDILLE